MWSRVGHGGGYIKVRARLRVRTLYLVARSPREGGREKQREREKLAWRHEGWSAVEWGYRALEGL